MTSLDEALRALEKVVELAAKASTEVWAVEEKEHSGQNVNHLTIGAPWQDVAHVLGSHNTMVDTVAGIRVMRANAELICAAVNFVREHGAALLTTRQEVAPVAWVERAKECDTCGGMVACATCDSDPSSHTVSVPRWLVEKIARDVGDIGMPKMEAALNRILENSTGQTSDARDGNE